MTTVNPPTSNGGAFEPLTLIRAEEMNDELDAVTYDLNYITGVLQAIYDKLDTIEPGAGATLDSDQIIALINLGSKKINIERLSEDVSSGSDVTVAIANHRATTTAALMHPETSIKSTELPYSTTPTSYVSSPSNLLDEIKNLRYAIHKVTGKTTWVDTPTENLTQLTAALDVVQSKLAGIENNATADQTPSEILTAIKTVDGPSSGLDADLLDGQHGSYYTPLTTLTAHTSNTSNPHNVTKTQIGLGNVTNDAQLKASALETGTTTTALATNVPSSYTMQNVINRAFGAGGGQAWLYKQDTSKEGGQINFETANTSSYPPSLYVDRFENFLRFISVHNGYTKEVIARQMDYSGYSSTTNLMSVNEMSTTLTIAASHWSHTAPNSVQNQIVGPALITGGICSRSDTQGYVEWSTGGAWTAFNVTHMAGTPTDGNNSALMGTIPCIYIPKGTTFSVRAGSTFSGSYSSSAYGGGYSIAYVRI